MAKSKINYQLIIGVAAIAYFLFKKKSIDGIGALYTIDNTKGKRPQPGEEFNLIVEFRTGSRYSYYGKTKKEATDQFLKKWGSFRGFVTKEWSIV
jgi:hypothetical protein